MNRSDSIGALTTALAKAQAEVEGATKDAKNPHFNSKYADLASVRDACLPALNKFGLGVLQFPSADGAIVRLETVLTHASGEWLAGEPLTVQAKDASPQAVGSAITYLRRYALAALAGVAPEDDDAEAAQGRGLAQSQPTKRPQPVAAPEGYGAWLDALQDTADEGKDKLREAWKTQPQVFRDHLTKHDVKAYEALRARAEKATVAA